jgi:HPt (histidine-containing phosphotransfer) domain-containing protein
MKTYLNTTSIDLTTIQAYASGNQNFIIEIINIYINEMPLEYELLCKEYEANNLKGISFQAHKMKSNAKLCGVEPLTEFLNNLENISDSENSNIETIIKNVKLSIDDSIKLLENVLFEMK